MRRASIVLCVLLLAALTACSAIPGVGQPARPTPAVPKSTEDSTAPEPTDSTAPEPTDSGDLPAVCSLLTKAEAEDVAGTPLEDAEDAAGTQCLYAGPVTGPTAQVEVFLGDGAKKFYDIDVELGHDFTPLDGVGDEAHAEENTVFGRVGPTWFAVRLVRLNDPADNAPLLADAAKTVADRLAAA